MDRKEIMHDCPEDALEHMKYVLDHLEGKFNEINDCLNIGCIDEIGQIVEAYNIAKEISDDLY